MMVQYLSRYLPIFLAFLNLFNQDRKRIVQKFFELF